LPTPGVAELGVRYIYDEPGGMPDILERVAAMTADDIFTMLIARIHSMSDAAAAHRESQIGHVRGKLVLPWTARA
jgi:NADPH:quinone reductase-like Zn-dependent oxidoreductase